MNTDRTQDVKDICGFLLNSFNQIDEIIDNVPLDTIERIYESIKTPYQSFNEAIVKEMGGLSPSHSKINRINRVKVQARQMAISYSRLKDMFDDEADNMTSSEQRQFALELGKMSSLMTDIFNLYADARDKYLQNFLK